MNTAPPNTPARTIDDVLAELDRIVEESLASGDRLGYFAALYRKVTRKVKEGIVSGYFEDGPRMERLDVVFADRYLDALAAYLRGDKPTLAWQLAFAAAGRWRPLILQQLLVGINAHINLDLGIAAATIAPGSSLAALRTDFDRINEILFSLVAEVENTIGEVSPWIAWLVRIGGKADDAIVRFSLKIARNEAWRFAESLAPLPLDSWAAKIEQKDRLTTLLGEEVLSPGPFLRWGLMLIRMRESNDVRRVIQLLAAMPEPELATLEASRMAKSGSRLEGPTSSQG